MLGPKKESCSGLGERGDLAGWSKKFAFFELS